MDGRLRFHGHGTCITARLDRMVCLWDASFNPPHFSIIEPIPDLTWNELEEFYPFPPPKEVVRPEWRKEESIMLLDLVPYIQIAPHTFEQHGSAERAYELFRSLGLRYVFIFPRAASILMLKTVMGCKDFGLAF